MMRLTVIWFLMAWSTIVWTQDVRFHNINENLSDINPALISSPKGFTVIGFGYREALNLAKSQSIATASNISPNRLSTVYGIRTFAINKLDVITLEARIKDDNPKNGLVARTDALMSFRYAKLLGSRGKNYQKLSIGTSIGLRMTRLTNAEFWFGSQYDILNERVDLGIPSGEISINQLSNRTGLDLSLGLAWTSHIHGVGDYYLSIAAFHLNPYNQAMYEGGSLPIERRYSVLVGLRKILSKKATWINTLMYEQQNVFAAVSLRTTAQYKVDEDTSVAIGLMPILRDSSEGVQFNSLNVFTAFHVRNIQLNISYDIGFGAISSVTDGRGSLELGIRYYFGRIELEEERLGDLY